MRRNPSPAQQEASRANLEGNEGPKTRKGRARSALNGRQNNGRLDAEGKQRRPPGPRTVKRLAIAMDRRFGLASDSYQAQAGCITCAKSCQWSSFSCRTPAEKLPLPCLGEVIERRPSSCFYYFEGRCFAPVGRSPSDDFCVLDPDFLSQVYVGRVDASRLELIHRKRVIAIIKEGREYIRRGAAQGAWAPTPRARRVLSELQRLRSTARPCRFSAPGSQTSGWRA